MGIVKQDEMVRLKIVFIICIMMSDSILAQNPGSSSDNTTGVLKVLAYTAAGIAGIVGGLSLMRWVANWRRVCTTKNTLYKSGLHPMRVELYNSLNEQEKSREWENRVQDSRIEYDAMLASTSDEDHLEGYFPSKEELNSFNLPQDQDHDENKEQMDLALSNLTALKERMSNLSEAFRKAPLAQRPAIVRNLQETRIELENAERQYRELKYKNMEIPQKLEPSEKGE